MRLVVTEKISVAQSIAKVLGAKPVKEKRGYLANDKYVVTWCQGHLVSLAMPEDYNDNYNQRKRESLPMLPSPWKHVVNDNTRRQFDVVSGLMNHANIDTIVCATDAGREGELIFRWVYQLSGSSKSVKRLWISSMEDDAIVKGFQNLRPSYEFDNLYQSAQARAKADWLVGMNCSRLFSLLSTNTVRVGRVLSPTLAMVVDRCKAIEDFVPTPFYTVSLLAPDLTLTSERMEDSPQATNLCLACNGQTATITKVDTKDKTTMPPKLYDLTTLQRDANRQHGFTAQQTLDYAQSLYMKKLITYPRTDSRYVTNDMKATVALLATIITPTITGNLMDCNVTQVVNNDKVTDHHALLPTKTVKGYNVMSLPAGEQAILHMISFRLVLALSNPYRYTETKLTAQCCEHTFTATGRTIVDKGFTALLPPSKVPTPSLPVLQEGDTLQVEAQAKEGKTSPPKYFTEDTLLSAMENANNALEDSDKKGIGTPATRASILEKLVQSNYLQRTGNQKTKHLQPTEIGQVLIGILPDELRSPIMTAQWEEQLQAIEQGKVLSHVFLNEIASTIKVLVDVYSDTPDNSLVMPSDKVSLGKCLRCGDSVVENSKGFYCTNRDCGYMVWKNSAYFANKKKTFTASLMHQLLTKDKVLLKGCYSKAKDTTYDCYVKLVDKVDDNGKPINFETIWR